MASYEDKPAAKRNEELPFKVLDALYNFSKGNKYVPIAFENLYQLLKANNDDLQKDILGALEYLADYRLIDSKMLGGVSITPVGIKEYERAILGFPNYPTHFPLDAVKSVFTESKKNEIKTINDQRKVFLHEAYRLSKGSIKHPVNLSDINERLRYDRDTLNKIYFYCQDEGLIKGFATGGVFTITRKGIERVREEGND
jgi:hypothetical protein